MSRLSSTDVSVLFAVRSAPMSSELSESWKAANDDLCTEVTDLIDSVCASAVYRFESQFGLEPLAQALLIDRDLKEAASRVSPDPPSRSAWDRMLISLGARSPEGTGWPAVARMFVRMQLERSVRRQVGWPQRPARPDLRDAPKLLGIMIKCAEDDVDIAIGVRSYLRFVVDDFVADRAHGLTERPSFVFSKFLKQLFGGASGQHGG